MAPIARQRKNRHRPPEVAVVSAACWFGEAIEPRRDYG
jgi:hypothetical protein